MSVNRVALAITSGEPAGIGPELVALLAQRHAQTPFAARLVILGDRALLAARATRIGASPRYADFDPGAFAPAGGVVEGISPLRRGLRATGPDQRAQCDRHAGTRGSCNRRVRRPRHRPSRRASWGRGYRLLGPYGFFAARHTPRVDVLVGGTQAAPLRVALATTHLPLKDVPGALTRIALAETLIILGRELQAKFGIAAPRIAVCGLNPHAGEGGHLGREEIDVIAPAIADARANGWSGIAGPLSADTLFVPDHVRRYDAVVAMFHDQGLPVLKAASFGMGINVTLGLPFPRTSVDHGTALDLARDPALARTADPGSLIAAVDLAIELANRASGPQ